MKRVGRLYNIEIYNEVKEILKEIERNLSEKIFNKCVCTIEFAKVVDYMYLQEAHFSTKEYKNMMETYFLAWPKILSLSYDDFKEIGYPLVSSNEELEIFTNQVLGLFSKIMAVKKLLSMAKYNILELSKSSMTNYMFTLKYKGISFEKREVDSYLEFREQQLDILAYTEKEADIYARMKDMVFVYRDKFIGYSAEKKVDEYYLVLATCISDKIWGKHDFPPNAKFGGVKYEDYVASIVAYISITLKHLDFCRILIAKEPKIKLIDIINVFHTIDEEVDTLVNVLNISSDTARIIINTLILRKDDIESVADNFNTTFPMFLQVAHNMVIKTNLAFLTDPFLCLLQTLEQRYPKDWSREINKREQLFRTQLYVLINKREFIKIDKNINIYKEKKRLTDIDALIIDETTKTMAIFQLKWQEPFGGSISERNSKRDNFISMSNKWINEVLNWIDTSSIKEKIDALGIKKKLLEEGWRYELFVIGRHFSHFSDYKMHDQRAAWCNWYKLNAICSKLNSYEVDNYFEELHRLIDEEYSTEESEDEIIDVSIVLGDYKFFTRQEK